MPKSNVSSPARSQRNPVTPRRNPPRGSRSTGSAASARRSNNRDSLAGFAANKTVLSDNTDIEMPRHSQACMTQSSSCETTDSFTFSLKNKTILTSNTDIERARRSSWWQKVDNSRDVIEVLNSNRPSSPTDVLEQFDGSGVLSEDPNTYNLNLPESSDNESINSIVVPPRKLFTQKENVPQTKFFEVVGNQESLAKHNKTSFNDKTVYVGTKNLFGKTSRKPKPIFPSALLNMSFDKTADKTKEAPTEVKAQPKNLFGNGPGTKRKNMFADFIVSESEDEISDIQPKLFAFHKQSEPLPSTSAASRVRREPSFSSSIATDTEMEDWKLLPSSTMVEHQLQVDLATPGKKARLSKLSEAKESTKDSIKQSDKSLTSKNKSKLLTPVQNHNSTKSYENNKSESSSRNKSVSMKNNTSQNKSNIVSNKLRNKSIVKEPADLNAEGTDVIIDNLNTSNKSDPNQNTTRNNYSQNKSKIVEKSQPENITAVDVANLNEEINKISYAKQNTRDINKTATLKRSDLDKSSIENENSTNKSNNANEISTTTDRTRIINKTVTLMKHLSKSQDIVDGVNQQQEDADRQKIVDFEVVQDQQDDDRDMNLTYHEDSDPEPKTHEDKSYSNTKVSIDDKTKTLCTDNGDNTQVRTDKIEVQVSKIVVQKEDLLIPNKSAQSTSKFIEEAPCNDYDNLNSSRKVTINLKENLQNELIEENCIREKSASVINDIGDIVENEQIQVIDTNDQEDVEMGEKQCNNFEHEEKKLDRDRDRNLSDHDKIEQLANDFSEQLVKHDNIKNLQEEENYHESNNALADNFVEQHIEDKCNIEKENGDIHELEMTPEVKQKRDPNHNEEDYEIKDCQEVENQSDDDHNEQDNELEQSQEVEYESNEDQNEDDNEVEMSQDVEQQSDEDQNENDNEQEMSEEDQNKDDNELEMSQEVKQQSDEDQNENDNEQEMSQEIEQQSDEDNNEDDNELEMCQEIGQQSDEDRNENYNKLEANQEVERQSDDGNNAEDNELKDSQEVKKQSDDDHYNELEANQKIEQHSDDDNNAEDNELEESQEVEKQSDDDDNEEDNELEESQEVESREVKKQSDDDHYNELDANQGVEQHSDDDNNAEDNELEESQEVEKQSDDDHNEEDNELEESQEVEQQSDDDHNEEDNELEDSQEFEQQSDDNHSEDGQENSNDPDVSHEIEQDSKNEEEDDGELIDASKNNIGEIADDDEGDQQQENDEDEMEIDNEEEIENYDEQQDVENYDNNQEMETRKLMVPTDKSIPRSTAEKVEKKRQKELLVSALPCGVQYDDGNLPKTKSIINNFISRNTRTSQTSPGLRDGTRNSSAEGSGWDSHRTTRKTLRQTFGPDFSPRKSIRTLVMEKSAKRQTIINEANAKLHQANSTELENNCDYEMDVDENLDPREEDREISQRTRQTTLEMYCEKIKKQTIEWNKKMEEKVRNSLEKRRQQHRIPVSDILNFPMPTRQPVRRIKTLQSTTKPKKAKRVTPGFFPLEDLPPEFVEDMKYKPPKRFKPRNASWITNRLYKFLESKLEPKYDYKARVRAEKLVETIYNFVQDARKVQLAPPHRVAELKREMARLGIVTTHFEFNNFMYDYLPLEVKRKVVPDIINNIPLPPEGIFSPIPY